MIFIQINIDKYLNKNKNRKLPTTSTSIKPSSSSIQKPPTAGRSILKRRSKRIEK